MKKFFSILLVCTSVLLTFASCSKEETYSHKIQGVWDYVSSDLYFNNEEVATIKDEHSDYMMKFNDGDAIVYYGEEDQIILPYLIDGNKLIIAYDTYEIEKLTNSELCLSYSLSYDYDFSIEDLEDETTEKITYRGVTVYEFDFSTYFYVKEGKIIQCCEYYHEGNRCFYDFVKENYQRVE